MGIMPSGYGQYCPLSIAAELLCQRWTLLVVSRLIDGCTRFNDIHRGVPRMSPSLLSKRLSELEDAGLVTRHTLGNSSGFEYRLTEAGQDLEDIIMGLAVWGQRWARDMEMEDLDPAFLVWSMHTRIDSTAMPPGRTVVEFDFTGAPKDGSKFWLVNTDDTVEMCVKDPGLDVDLVVSSDLRIFVEAWRGFRDLRHEIQRRRIRLLGPQDLRDRFPGWLRLSALAPYRRKRPGRERRLAEAHSAGRERTARKEGASPTEAKKPA